MAYLWIKSFHLISLISWFAGLFYLPRLFVYYAESAHPSTRATLLTMQLRLWKIIMVPASALTALFGLILLALNRDVIILQVWFHLKALLLLILYGYHFYLGKILTGFEKGVMPKTGKFYRLLNEVPTLILILIIILVVVKPWTH